METVREQYERHPYPPVPLLALPRRGQGKRLAYETGRPGRTHEGIRILIAGCGTLEPLIVAETHPRAREIVAVDLSAASIQQARFRLNLARVAPSRLFHRPARVRFVPKDLFELSAPDEGTFDYIIASNVIHHSDRPAGLLKHLAGLLSPEGLMRVVTYPKASRYWMRAVSQYLRSRGLGPGTPQLKGRAHEAIHELPENSPLRLAFESQPETRHATGIVDAFFHSMENPLAPLEWARACADAGLRLLAEGQADTSRSTFLDELFPEMKSLNAWIKLQILDDLLELCSNPVFWFEKTDTPWTPPEMPQVNPADSEFKQNLTRVAALAAPVGLSLEQIFEKLRMEVGPRVSPSNPEQVLGGLALSDYELKDLLG